MRRKVLIDTDPGVDDAVALALAFCLPELEVVGLTSVGGNASIEHTTRNLAALMTALGQEQVPLARGAAAQINGAPFEHAYHVHGEGGLGIDLPSSSVAPGRLGASDLILKAAREHGAALTIIALGPLTNLAEALQWDGSGLEGVAEIVVMGGALRAPGNIRPEAEFNIFSDPLAASAILGAGVPVRLAPLDVTRQTFLTRERVAELQGRGRAADLAARLVGAWFEGRPDRQHFALHDPLAVAAAAAPDLLEWEAALVEVETDDPERLGKTTLVEGSGHVLAPRAVHAAEAVDFIVGTLASG